MATKLRGVRARMPTEVELVETGSQDGDHHAEAAASDHADYEGDSAIDHADHEGEDSAIDHADLEGGGDSATTHHEDEQLPQPPTLKRDRLIMNGGHALRTGTSLVEGPTRGLKRSYAFLH